MTAHPPFLTLINQAGALTLRVTHEGQIKAEYPVTARNAALLVVEAAIFLRSRVKDENQ